MLLPLSLLNLTDKYDVRIDVIGGGLTGQAEASTLGLSRAVLEISEDFSPTLREHGLLTQDREKRSVKNMENAVLEKVHNSENDKDYTFRIRTYNKVSSKGLDLFL